MFDHLLESSHRDDSNKWSTISVGEEIGIIEMKLRPCICNPGRVEVIENRATAVLCHDFIKM